MTEAEHDAMLDAELVDHVRATAKVVMGGNCTFADSDVTMLGRLAKRAIVAGLIDGFDRPTTYNLNRMREEFAASTTDARNAKPRVTW